MLGAIVVFLLGGVLGFALGRIGISGDDGTIAIPSPSPATSVSPMPQPTVVVTPTPGEAPAISTAGQILSEGDRRVVPASAAAPCQALVSAGTLGQCGEVAVAGGRVVWVVEQAPTPGGAPAFAARIFTFVPDASGWVEWLQASDPTGELWSGITIVPSDLTGDGVPELLVGFRKTGEDEVLEVDVVSYEQDNLPSVVAHPDPSGKGVAVAAGGTLQLYDAQYPNGEPVCCPPTYVRTTIGFGDGFFRVVAAETVPANTAPASQL